MRSQYSASSRKWVVTITVTPRSTMALMCDQNSRRVERIDARGRLVEEQHRRVVHDRAGQGQPLLEAQRQLAGVAVEVRAEAERRRPCGRSSLAPAAAGAGRRRRRRSRGSAGRSGRRRARTSGPCSRAAPGPRTPARYRSKPATRAEPGRRPQQAAHHLERGRLAGAVGAEQAEDLAAADAEGDPVGGGEVAEPLGQPVGLDDGARRLAAAARGRRPAASRPSGRRRAGRRRRPRTAAATGSTSSSAAPERRRRRAGWPPASTTSRTLLPWITPSITSGRFRAAASTCRRPRRRPGPGSSARRRARSAPPAGRRRATWPSVEQRAPSAQRSASSR